MNKLRNLFSPKQPDTSNDLIDNDPQRMPEPTTPVEFQRRGYAFYSRAMYAEAEADFRKAIEIDPQDIDSLYALGMTLKASQQNEDGVATFRRVVDRLDSGEVPSRDRHHMVRRLALGHLNEISTGDWNLEKEIWKRKE